MLPHGYHQINNNFFIFENTDESDNSTLYKSAINLFNQMYFNYL